MVFVGIGDDELRDGDRVVLLSALNGAGIRAVSSSEDESASATLHMAPGIALASFVHQPDEGACVVLYVCAWGVCVCT